jgi:hypothetical protein
LTDTQTRETVAVLLDVSTSLAGLMLVFAGFIYVRGESFANERTKDKYKNVARAAFGPFAMALLSAWLCLSYLQGGSLSSDLAVLTFRGTLVALWWYAFVVLFIYL